MGELNPKHDLARHTYDPTSFLNIFKDAGTYLFNCGKSVVRGGVFGGVVGAGLGAFYSLVSGEDVLNGVKYGVGIGSSLGLGLDVIQYNLRYKISLFSK